METEYGLQFVDYLRQAVSEGVVVVDSEGYFRLADEAADVLGYGPEPLTSVNLADNESTELSRLMDGPAGALVHGRSDGHASAQDAQTVFPPDLKRLSERLSDVQRLAGVGTLTASMAHELTNSLSVITAACANLKEELTGGELTAEEVGRYAEMIEQSAFRCAGIIDVLRRYTQSDTGGLNMAITSPADILRDALTMVEQQFRKRANVLIDADVAPGLQTIVCDHNAITQVLINLLLNARDALFPGGGTLLVRFWPLGTLVRPSHGVNGTSHAPEAREYFAFSVSDRGAGIDPGATASVFDPFYMAGPDGKGGGVGLFIARDLVERHGGRVWAENNPGGGATFTVVLPKRQ